MFPSDREDSVSVGTNSKSREKVDISSKSRSDTFRDKENSSNEMTQTERTLKTKKAKKIDSNSERDSLRIASTSKKISKAKNSKGNVC